MTYIPSNNVPTKPKYEVFRIINGVATIILTTFDRYAVDCEIAMNWGGEISVKETSAQL